MGFNKTLQQQDDGDQSDEAKDDGLQDQENVDSPLTIPSKCGRNNKRFLYDRDPATGGTVVESHGSRFLRPALSDIPHLTASFNRLVEGTEC